MRRHENKNNKINKYIIENKDDDEVLVNAAITLSEDESNIMDKHNMTRGRQVTIDETQIDTHFKNQQSARELTWVMHSSQKPTRETT